MKNYLLWVLVLVLSGTLLTGCGSSGGSDGATATEAVTDTITDPVTNPGTDPATDPGTDPGADPGTDPVTDPTPTVAALDPVVLDSAASFLAAATGKENPITSDEVIFINTMLEINALDRTPSCLYGDLWVLLRDKYGIPILDDVGCTQPIASEPVAILVLDGEGNPIPVLDENGAPVLDEGDNPVYEVTYSDYVPMFVEEYKNGEAKCSIVAGYENYTQELDLGRLNMVRSSANNPNTLNRAFEEAMKNINAADSVTLDLSGRLVLHSTVEVIDPDTGLLKLVAKEATIDAPRENLALYRAMLKEGRLAGYGVAKIGEEGETIPAPWLELRPDLGLGALTYLREGTPGRDYGVDLIENYADLSPAIHDRSKDYHNKIVAFVQYNPPAVVVPADINATDCRYYDSFADAWERILDAEEAKASNLAGFTRHADDARRVITFMHEIIQGLPETGNEPGLPPVPGYEPPMENPPANDPRMLDFAAAMLGGAANKTVPVNVDAVVFINTVLDINELGITDKGELFGDLWVLDRDENGVPSLNPIGCEQPIATELLMVPDQSLTPYPLLDENELPIPVFDVNGNPTLDANGDPVYVLIESPYVPLFEEVYKDGAASKCGIIPGYEEYAQEFAMGRLNCVRNAADDPHVLEKHLVEAMNELNTAEVLKRDLGGRLVYSVPYVDEFGEKQLRDKTIDSPLQNLAIYRALMLWGSLSGTVNIKQEGKYVDVPIEFADTVDLDTNGLGFLRGGGNPNAGIARLANGYADYSGYHHNSQHDTEEIAVDYVQWHDPQEAGYSCEYTDESGFSWDRILGADDYDGTGIGAFAKHGDDARKVITFTHNIIQDMPE